MVNPDNSRDPARRPQDRHRSYPASRVTQALYFLIALVVIAWVISLIY